MPRPNTMTTKNTAAQALRSIPSASRSEASRSNGSKGGRHGYEIFDGVLMMPVLTGGKRRWTVKGMSGVWGSQEGAASAAHHPTGRNVTIAIQADGSVVETVLA